MFQTSTPIRNVHSQVADRVGLSIVRGDIGAGETLPSEMQICEMMDVSRTVVREVIRTLTGKGLVEARTRSGTRVRPPQRWNQLDPDVLRWRLELSDLDSYLAKLFQLRCAVEPAAAALAATHAEPDDVQSIRVAYEGMAAAKNNEAFVAADIAFHQAIYFATRNEFFWPIAQMFDVALRQSFTIAARGSHRARALVEHHAVLKAIAKRDADGARKATNVLLNNSVDDLVRIRGREFAPRSKPSKTPARRG